MWDKKLLLLSVGIMALSWQHVNAAAMTLEELRERLQRVRLVPGGGQEAPAAAPAVPVVAPEQPIAAVPARRVIRRAVPVVALEQPIAAVPARRVIRRAVQVGDLTSAPAARRVIRRAVQAVADPVLFDATLIRDVLVPEFVRLMGPGSASYSNRDYDDVYHYLNISVQLAERADAIVEYMRGKWDDIVANRPIPSPAYEGISIPLYQPSNFGAYYREVVEAYIIALQASLPKPHGLYWSYMPMFETVDYAFGAGMAIQKIPEDLPEGMTEAEYKEIVLNGTKHQLIDGPRLLTRAVRLIQKHPEMAMTLFQNGLKSGGCLPVRNASLERWLNRNDPDSMNTVGIFANIIKTKLDPDIQLADIVNLYRGEKIKELRRRGVKFKDMSDTQIGQSEELQESYTMTKIAAWIRKMFRDASQEDFTLAYTLNPGFKPYELERTLWDRLKAFEDIMFLGMIDDVPAPPPPVPAPPPYGYGGAAAYGGAYQWGGGGNGWGS